MEDPEVSMHRLICLLSLPLPLLATQAAPGQPGRQGQALHFTVRDAI